MELFLGFRSYFLNTSSSAWHVDIHHTLLSLLFLCKSGKHQRVSLMILRHLKKWCWKGQHQFPIPDSLGQWVGLPRNCLFCRKKAFWVQWYFPVWDSQPTRGFKGSVGSLWGSLAERLGISLLVRVWISHWKNWSPERMIPLSQVAQQSVFIQQIPLEHLLFTSYSSRCWGYSCEGEEEDNNNDS